MKKQHLDKPEVRRPEVGDQVLGYTVTEVREDGVIFGVKGSLDKSTIEDCRRARKPGEFKFRPGIAFARVTRFDRMTLNDLRREAARLGVPLYKKMGKIDLIETLTEAHS